MRVRYFVALAVMASVLYLGPRHLAAEGQTSVQKKADNSFSDQLGQLSPEEKKSLRERKEALKKKQKQLKKLEKQRARELRKKRRPRGKKRKKR